MSSPQDIPVQAFHCQRCQVDNFYLEINNFNLCVYCFEQMKPLTPENCCRGLNNTLSLQHLKYFRYTLKLNV